MIPNPTDETIAELKRKLNEEQETYTRAEGSAIATAATEGQAQNDALFLKFHDQLLWPGKLTLECQYTLMSFCYIPPECEDMFRAYQTYLQQQDYEAPRKQEPATGRLLARTEKRHSRKDEDAARRRQREIEKWSNFIEGSCGADVASAALLARNFFNNAAQSNK